VPAQRQTNEYSHSAMLPEVRDEDGTLYPACEVDPGEAVGWPRRLTGFSGWVEPDRAEAPVTAPVETAPAEGPAVAKTGRAKAAAPATSTDEKTTEVAV